ncbi:MAG: endonuclease/exonuclease/phosphatase family protein [Thermodesulfobacteriota bacterium]
MNTFSALTFNLRFGLAADDGPARWEVRKKSVAALFQQHPADFIALQEANDFQIDFLGEVLKQYNFIGKRLPAPAFWQNNVIFYKAPWKCLAMDHFYLSPTPSIPSRFRKSRWPRQCTIGLFKNGERRLLCINTHFDFDARVRVNSARLILERLSAYPPDMAAVLMGDFNATPEGDCYKIFTTPPANESDRKPVFKNAFKHPYPGTHHGFTGISRDEHIDWILYRGDMNPENSLVLADCFNGIFPSDHFPVKVIFRWAGND